MLPVPAWLLSSQLRANSKVLTDSLLKMALIRPQTTDNRMEGETRKKKTIESLLKRRRDQEVVVLAMQLVPFQMPPRAWRLVRFYILLEVLS